MSCAGGLVREDRRLRVLREVRLLVLDEPTSHVDEDSENEVAKALDRLHDRCTVVVVSHRPAVLCNADVLLHLDTAGASDEARSRDLVGATAE